MRVEIKVGNEVVNTVVWTAGPIEVQVSERCLVFYSNVPKEVDEKFINLNEDEYYTIFAE